MSSKKQSREKKFSCVHCNHPFVSFPPDDLHTTASLDPNAIENPIEVTHECSNCESNTTLYWGQRKISVFLV